MAAKATSKSDLLNRSELARVLDVAPGTVDSWRRRGVPTEGTPGAPRFVLALVVEWRIERARVEAKRDDDTIDLDALRKRRALADTELAELALEEARGELVPLDLVAEIVGEIFDNVRRRLLAFPGRYAARAARLKGAAKVKGLLLGATREVLDELADGEAVARRSREDAAGSPSRVRAAASRKTR